MLLCMFMVIASGSYASNESKEKPADDYLSLREAATFFAHVAERVQRDYVEEVTNTDILEGALVGMLSALDPHSTYLSPKKFDQIRRQSKGEYSGLGIEMTMEEGVVKVVSAMEGAPADEAGLLPGDLIVKIDDEPVFGLTIIEASEKLRGKKGSTVKLNINRRADKRIFDVVVNRNTIKVTPVKTAIVDNIGYIRITTFNEATTKNLMKSIKEISDKLGPKLIGYVIDMRNNAGGLFEQAVSVSDLFLSDGLIVSIKGKNEKNFFEFRTKTKDMTDGKPLVVLINSGSASASEIVAGALQDHNRATIVGTRSFGKGSVQTVIPMTNNGAIKMTTALYYTPKNRSIQKLGITPDITISEDVKLSKLEKKKYLREEDLEDALENGGTIKKIIIKKKVSGKKESSEDYQLLQSFNILRAIHWQYAKKI